MIMTPLVKVAVLLMSILAPVQATAPSSSVSLDGKEDIIACLYWSGGDHPHYVCQPMTPERCHHLGGMISRCPFR